MRLISICSLALLSLLSLQAAGPAIVHVYGYDASGNLTYDCQAKQNSTLRSWSVAAATVTNIVVASGTATVNFPSAPGLYAGALITITGVTALNGSYPISTITGTAATFATSASSATYTSGLVITTTRPNTNAPVWDIQKFAYSATGILQASYWLTDNTLRPCVDASSY